MPKKDKKEDDYYLNDCPICQAMKKMGVKMEKYDDRLRDNSVFESGFEAVELTKKQAEELKRAFKEAKKKRAIVGRDWFEKK